MSQAHLQSVYKIWNSKSSRNTQDFLFGPSRITAHPRVENFGQSDGMQIKHFLLLLGTAKVGFVSPKLHGPRSEVAPPPQN